MIFRATGIVCLLLSLPLWGQTPSFEVASVKLDGTRWIQQSNYTATDTSKWCELSGTRFTCNLMMNDLLEEAFGLEPWRILAPNWIYKADKVKVEAITPPDTTLEAAKRMLPGLLAERFGLVFHHEQRIAPVYLLVQGKGGARVKPIESWEKARTIETPLTEGGRPVKASILFADDRIEAAAFPIKNLAVNLSFRADRPVIDATGLEGNFEFIVRWDWQSDRAANDRESLDALQRQLNLRLENGDMPIEFVIIDHLEKSPTEN